MWASIYRHQVWGGPSQEKARADQAATPAPKAALALLCVARAPAWRPSPGRSGPSILGSCCRSAQPVLASPTCLWQSKGINLAHRESLVWPPRETKPSSSALWPQHVLLPRRPGRGEVQDTPTPLIQNAPCFQACRRPECLPRSTEVSPDSFGQAPHVLHYFWGRVGTPHPHCTRKSSVHPWN